MFAETYKFFHCITALSLNTIIYVSKILKDNYFLFHVIFYVVIVLYSFPDIKEITELLDLFI